MRDIDWNVTHRLGRPFVKRFREERELTAVLAVDVSASSSFGSANRTKREFAAEIAATLAMSAAKNGDKVALLLFTDEVELFVPPRKGRRHILRIVREMLMFKPRKRGTDISSALGFLESRSPPPRDCVSADGFFAQRRSAEHRLGSNGHHQRAGTVPGAPIARCHRTNSA